MGIAELLTALKAIGIGAVLLLLFLALRWIHGRGIEKGRQEAIKEENESVVNATEKLAEGLYDPDPNAGLDVRVHDPAARKDLTP